jgi:hypothetical protein
MLSLLLLSYASASAVAPPSAGHLRHVSAGCSLDKVNLEEKCEVTGLPLVGDIGLGA